MGLEELRIPNPEVNNATRALDRLKRDYLPESDWNRDLGEAHNMINNAKKSRDLGALMALKNAFGEMPMNLGEKKTRALCIFEGNLNDAIKELSRPEVINGGRESTERQDQEAA